MVESAEAKPVCRERFWWLSPALVAIYPVITLYTESIEEANTRDAAICGFVIVAVAIVLAYLLRHVFSGATRASLAAVVIIVWAFSYSSYMRVGRLVIESVTMSPWNEYVLIGVWLSLLPAALYWLYRLRWSDGRMKRLYQFTELACFFSVGVAVLHGARGDVHSQRGDPAAIWGSDREAMPAAWKPQPMRQQRDVYYLLFDRYGNEETLQRFFNYDDSEFYNELEKRGFIVDRRATTSYPMTGPSMASTLNMRYLNSQFQSVFDYFAWVPSNEVAKLFSEAGYHYRFFGNQYEPLRKSSTAEWNLKISTMPCEFAEMLVTMTPLRPLIGRQHKRQFVVDKCDKIAALAKNPDLTFAYAHFLVPHPPYAFAHDGSPQTELARATWPEQELYIDQLVATNRLILKLLDDLLGASEVKPIIVLQADEGPYLMTGDEALTRDEQMAKRLGVLNAIYVPDGEVRQQLSKPPKPVNTFRFLFKEYFSAPIEFLPDEQFYWEKADPTGAASPGTRIIEVGKKSSGDI